METFIIKEDGFKELRDQYLLRMIPMSLVASVAAIGMVMYNSKDEMQDLNVWPIIIPFLVLILGLGMFMGAKRLKASWASYQLTVDDNEISRYQSGMPQVTIPRSEIKEIIKYKNGSFRINGQAKGDIILVPAQIENYDALEASLHSFSPVIQKPANALVERYYILISILSMVPLVVVYISDNKWVVAIAGAVLVALMTYSFLELKRSKNVDSKTKFANLFSLIVVIAVIGMVIYKVGR